MSGQQRLQIDVRVAEQDLSCPVELVSVRLDVDKETGEAACFPVFRSVSEGLTAFEFSVTTLNVFGEVLFAHAGGDIVQDIAPQKGEEIPPEQPVLLEAEPNTRDLRVRVVRAVDGDGLWTDKQAEPVTPPVTPALDVPELERLQQEFGADAVGVFCRDEDVWVCVCSRANRLGQANCRRCGRAYDLVSKASFESLRAHVAVFDIAPPAEEPSPEAAEDPPQPVPPPKPEEPSEPAGPSGRPPREIITRGSVIGFILVALCALMWLGYVYWLEPSMQYTEALKKARDGQFEESIGILRSLDGEMDVGQDIRRITLEWCRALSDGGEYDAALRQLKTLGEDEETRELTLDILYQNARALELAGDTAAAAELYRGLGNYQDAAERLEGLTGSATNDPGAVSPGVSPSPGGDAGAGYPVKLLLPTPDERGDPPSQLYSGGETVVLGAQLQKDLVQFVQMVELYGANIEYSEWTESQLAFCGIFLTLKTYQEYNGDVGVPQDVFEKLIYDYFGREISQPELLTKDVSEVFYQDGKYYWLGFAYDVFNVELSRLVYLGAGYYRCEAVISIFAYDSAQNKEVMQEVFASSYIIRDWPESPFGAHLIAIASKAV